MTVDPVQPSILYLATFLAGIYRSKEIANELVISIGTVKRNTSTSSTNWM